MNDIYKYFHNQFPGAMEGYIPPIIAAAPDDGDIRGLTDPCSVSDLRC